MIILEQTPNTLLQAALSILATTPLRAPKTLADINGDNNDVLDNLVYEHAGRLCTHIEFHDDTYAHAGRRSLEYYVVTPCHSGREDRDEDGKYRDTFDMKTIIYVFVHPEMTLLQIAEAVAIEVRDIEFNVFA